MAAEMTRKDMSAGGAGADEDRATDAGDRPGAGRPGEYSTACGHLWHGTADAA